MSLFSSFARSNNVKLNVKREMPCAAFVFHHQTSIVMKMSKYTYTNIAYMPACVVVRNENHIFETRLSRDDEKLNVHTTQSDITIESDTKKQKQNENNNKSNENSSV